VVVAVIDSGVDITHPELATNVWINTDEIMGDGIDNDNNGYIDDIFGWNFGLGQFDNLVLPGTENAGQDHGTHVAGIIAAENDGLGMTGVAHNAQIMSLRLGDIGPGPQGSNIFTNGGSLVEAIYYAVDNGADIINLSLSASGDGLIRNPICIPPICRGIALQCPYEVPVLKAGVLEVGFGIK
jgi:subtilisin